MTNIAAALLCCCDGGGPGECGECPPVVITWSGSAAYAGICCVTEDGGFSVALNCWTFTANHDIKESPAFTDLCAASAQKVTAFSEPSIDTECEADACLFDASVSLGVRLRFRLFRGETEWAIVIESSGDIPSLAPNEVGGTGWSLRWTAPISTCPPASGWTWDEDGSTLPIVGTVTCDPPYDNTGVGVTSFSVGSVSVSTA